MRIVNDSDSFRKNVQNMLNQKIQNSKISSNLETGIYNATLEKAEQYNVLKQTTFYS